MSLIVNIDLSTKSVRSAEALLLSTVMVSIAFRGMNYAKSLHNVPLALKYARRDCPLSDIVVSDTLVDYYQGVEEDSSVICKGHGIAGGTFTPLILKFNTHLERMKTEARTYKNLRSLQGSVIPHCYGLLTGPKPNDSDDSPQMACLALEEFGTYPDVYLYEHPRPVKEKILRNLTALHHHKHGGLFSNFNPGNIVHKNGEYRMVHLSDLQPLDSEHDTCNKSLAWLDTPFSARPPDIDPICTDLWYEARGMAFWDTYSVHFIHGITVERKNLPVQEDINKLRPNLLHTFGVTQEMEFPVLQLYYERMYELLKTRSSDDLLGDAVRDAVLCEAINDYWLTQQPADVKIDGTSILGTPDIKTSLGGGLII